MSSSNVIAAPWDIIVQRNASFEYYFRFKDADGVFINLTTVFDIRADVRNVSGAVVASFRLEDGLTINPDDNTGVFMRKLDSEKNIFEGVYNWDFKVTVTEGHAQYPLRGKYKSVNYITE